MNGVGKTKIPVIILTGFLGSGKTTALNRVLKSPDMKSTAVIINEFGEIGIDHLLVETSTEQIVELNNGCVCCSVRGDLVEKLGALTMWLDVGRVAPVERVIVETTGLADPAPIIHTLMTDEHLLSRYRLDKVVTLVDAIAGPSSTDRFPEAVKQIAIADHLVVSKTDLVGSLSSWDAYGDFKARIRGINPRASVHEPAGAALDVTEVFRESRDDADAFFADFSGWLRSAGHAAECGDSHEDHSHAHPHHHEAAGITSFSVEWEMPVAAGKFNDFLQKLAIEFGPQLLRMKGIVYVEDAPERPAAVHGVQHVFFPVTWLDKWPEGGRSTRLVFITQDLAPEIIRGRLQAFFA